MKAITLAKLRQQLRRQRLGDKNPNYKGGKAMTSDGYVSVPAPERGKGGPRKLLHRVVAKARKGEKVHHKNHKRSDYARSNLKVTKKHPGVAGKY